MRVYRIKPGTDLNPHCEDSIEATLSAVEMWLQEGTKGTKVIIEIMEMTKEEFIALPEYEGP